MARNHNKAITWPNSWHDGDNDDADDEEDEEG
jgi:hypothetical protein